MNVGILETGRPPGDLADRFGDYPSMFAGLLFEVPEIITGGIGLAFVAAAYYSSLRFRKLNRAV